MYTLYDNDYNKYTEHVCYNNVPLRLHIEIHGCHRFQWCICHKYTFEENSHEISEVIYVKLTTLRRHEFAFR